MNVRLDVALREIPVKSGRPSLRQSWQDSGIHHIYHYELIYILKIKNSEIINWYMEQRVDNPSLKL